MNEGPVDNAQRRSRVSGHSLTSISSSSSSSSSIWE